MFKNSINIILFTTFKNFNFNEIRLNHENNTLYCNYNIVCYFQYVQYDIPYDFYFQFKKFKYLDLTFIFQT